jgi:hypothetical protein
MNSWYDPIKYNLMRLIFAEMIVLVAILYIMLFVTAYQLSTLNQYNTYLSNNIGNETLSYDEFITKNNVNVTSEFIFSKNGIATLSSNSGNANIAVTHAYEYLMSAGWTKLNGYIGFT